ncbi:hypothetical protein HGRIS_003524 [Hohenbuehelia grisea]|uniref:Pheromone receptor n=1 Tax=Hohenbuehelia grisea TaxID=104357 RepID=A0ABR3JG23_9AGAR
MASAFSICVLVANFLAFILFMIPLPWYLKSWNIGPCVFMIWRGLRSLIDFINGLVWLGSIRIVAPFWCDFSIKLKDGASFALAASALATNRRIYLLLVAPWRFRANGKSRRMIFEDLAIALGVPLVLTLLLFIPQSRRFDIYEDLGCMSAYSSTVVAVILFPLPTLVLGVISLIYGVTNVVYFVQKQKELREILSSKPTTLQPRQYFRLMGLGLVDTIVTVPSSAFVLRSYIKTNMPFDPFILKKVKADYAVVYQIPRSLWASNSVEMQIGTWFNIATAVIFFAVFGTSRESVNRYRQGAAWVAGIFRRKSSMPSLFANYPRFAVIFHPSPNLDMLKARNEESVFVSEHVIDIRGTGETSS